MRVADVMSEDPVWVDVAATTGEAIVKLLGSRVHHLPVLEGGVVIGIVSDRDLGWGSLAPVAPGEDLSAAARSLDEPVSSVMSRDVATVTPDHDLRDVAEVMIRRHIGAVPVVDPETTKLIGIVTTIDVLTEVRDKLWG